MKPSNASSAIWLEYEDGGTTVEMKVVPVNVWLGVHDNLPMWFMYVQDVTTLAYLDLRLTSIKRFWRPKTSAEMQLSGTAVFHLSRGLPV